jgi:hypothetical protein
MPRPKLRIGEMMIVIAVLTIIAWSIRYAATPSYPKGWIYGRVDVHDGPIRPPLGVSRPPDGQLERSS